MKMNIPRKVAPKPAVPKSARTGPFGMLPLPAGKIVTKGLKLTDKERETLLAAGWREDDPVPENMAAILTQATEDMNVATGKMLPELAKRPALAMPDAVDIDDLPDERRSVVEQALQFAKQQMAADDAMPPRKTGLLGSNTKIVDDRRSVREMPIRQPTFNEPPPQPAEPVATPDAGARDLTIYCAHCGWDQKQPDPTEPSNMDKRGFLQAVLGDGRFIKQYSLFDNKLIVVYRTLTAQESEHCWSALQAANQTMTHNDIYQKIIEYRLACGLESVTLAGGGTTTIPTLDEFLAEGVDLLEIVERIRKEIIKYEPLWRVTGVTFTKFQRLVEKMEARAADPNFWKATEERL